MQDVKMQNVKMTDPIAGHKNMMDHEPGKICQGRSVSARQLVFLFASCMCGYSMSKVRYNGLFTQWIYHDAVVAATNTSNWWSHCVSYSLHYRVNATNICKQNSPLTIQSHAGVCQCPTQNVNKQTRGWAVHSIQCITHAGHSITWNMFFFALCDPVTLTFNLWTWY